MNIFNYSTVQLADALNPGQANADNFDISTFAARGGKFIHYHVLADGLIPDSASIDFYKQVLSALVPKGVEFGNFYKFYLIPGAQHCVGSVGDAPWYIGGGNQPFSLGDTVHDVPGFEDPKHDAVLALMEWVEKGVVPQGLIATKYVDYVVKKGVKSQRPLCPYPGKATYSGQGDPNAAKNWVCQELCD